MKKKYELVVKEINNYPDKIAVTVALEIGGHPSLLLPHVAISLDRTEGATLEFYEAEAKKQAKQFFMDVAAGLCEGDGPLPEKRPVILEAQDVLENGIMYRLAGKMTPYSHHLDAGRFSVKTGEAGNGHAFTQVKFTPKGVQWIAGLLAAWRATAA
ncbi:DUF1327 domain-containing protein [Escherichia coli]|nr:DUF1327 domain-containing protein [Escherichia coli]EFD2687833.1 DUF1327 domain-containing protein [Escherichia coli]EFJ4511565.1 DUF1327 domain-containing protein [Escherichia coli]